MKTPGFYPAIRDTMRSQIGGDFGIGRALRRCHRDPSFGAASRTTSVEPS